MNRIKVELLQPRIVTGFLLLAAMLIVAGTPGALAQDRVVVEGEPQIPDRIAGNVIQASSGAEIPNGMEVTLVTYDASNIPVGEQSVAMGADGAFGFSEFPKTEGYRYELQTLHGNLRYLSLLGRWHLRLFRVHTPLQQVTL